MNQKVMILIRVLLALVCLFLVFHGYSIPGKSGLWYMLGGLAGMLVLLWHYNKPYSTSKR